MLDMSSRAGNLSGGDYGGGGGAAMSDSNEHDVDMAMMREELKRVRSQLDETRSELSKFQINYAIMETQVKQTTEKQQLEMERLKKKVHFLMEKRFLDYMKASNQQQQQQPRRANSSNNSNSEEEEEEKMEQMVDDELVITF